MPSTGHKNVNLPTPLVERVDKFVEENDWGYTKRAQVVQEAVRRLLEHHLKLEKIEREAGQPAESE